MNGIAELVLASASFVGSHLLLSHPGRRPLVRAMGERAFAGVYSLVAAVTLALTVRAYRAAPTTSMLWPVGDALWWVATILMLLASVLLAGSLLGNQAVPGGGAPPPVPEAARGVFAVTRHPMMWSFALWAACHAAVFPVTKNIVLATAIAVLALAGAAGQDRKKEVNAPATWPVWRRRTSFVPFAAIAAGRARFGGFGWGVLAGGTALWLAATWAHGPLAGWPAGIWRFI